MLVASYWLAKLYYLPIELIVLIGIVNLAYGSFSLVLSFQDERPMNLIKSLAIANLSWAGVIASMGVWHIDSASVFGLTHLFGEGIYVGVLGYCEWRYRELLTSKCPVTNKEPNQASEVTASSRTSS